MPGTRWKRCQPLAPLEEGRPADFARLKRAQDNLAFTNLVLKTAIEATPDGMLIVDAKNRILCFNQHFIALFGVPTEASAAGLPAGPLERFGASIVEEPDEFIARIRHLNAHPEEIGHEQLRLRDGRICDRHSTGLFGPDKRYLGRIWFFRDVTEQRRAEAQLEAMARADPLTGLVNRTVLSERLGQAIAAARRGGSGFAVLLVDLDHFKGINDSFGHGAGDAVLREVGRRLAGAIRETDLAARLGGDEFVVLQAEVEDPINAGRLATTLRSLLARPYPLENGQAHLTLSIGIAVYAPDIGDADDLLKQADRALYRAKQQGRDRYRFHSSALDQSVLDRIEIAEGVRAAVGTGELELFFQPNVAIASGALSGIDVVVCWRDPVRGLVIPERILMAADAAAIVPAMAHWALDRACRQLDAWRREGLLPPPLGLRLSAAELAPARRFDRVVADVLALWRIAPASIEFNLSEAVFARLSRSALEMLQRLSRLGAGIAIDQIGDAGSLFGNLTAGRIKRWKLAPGFLASSAASRDAEELDPALAVARLAAEWGIEIIAPRHGDDTAAEAPANPARLAGPGGALIAAADAAKLFIDRASRRAAPAEGGGRKHCATGSARASSRQRRKLAMARPACPGQNPCKGAVAVELAILLPVMLLATLGMAEFGRAIWTQATLDYAVQAAARCAAVDQTNCGTAAQTQQYAAGKAAGLTVAASNFAVSAQACGIAVTASLPFQLAVPALFPYSLTLSASACFPV